MPHFTLTLSSNGPLVDVVVGVSEPRRHALEAAGLPIPSPTRIRALTDTGASSTCIDPAVLSGLGLTPTSTTLCVTPSTGIQPVEKNVYDVLFAIPVGNNGVPFVRPTLAVMECDLLQSQGFHALIGRDVLADCLLAFNGTAGYFTLAY